MAEIKINELPVILESEFTENDRFLIVDDGKARLLTKTVFESWVNNNLQGERGLQGLSGRDGVDGKDGVRGADGAAGLSAYQVAVNGGYVGTVSNWLLSLKGATGANGIDGSNGWSPLIKTTARGLETILQVTDWVGGTGTKPTTLGYLSETGIVSNPSSANNIKGATGERGLQGEKGDTGGIGVTGERGLQGERGEQGLSAYQVALITGYIGTEQEWITSLGFSEGYRLKLDGLSNTEITQELGQSLTSVPSQKLLTDNLTDIATQIGDIETILTSINGVP